MVHKFSHSIILFVFIIIACTYAVPIKKEEYQLTIVVDLPSMKKISSTDKYFGNYNFANALDNHYRSIAGQVLETNINEIIQIAPETYSILHELQFIGKDYCRTSVLDFMQVIVYQLNELRNDLLASIRPCIDEIADKNYDIHEINTIVSQKLGSLSSPIEVTRKIIKHVFKEDEHNAILRFWKLHTDKKWAQTIHHEENESRALESWLHSWLMDFEFILKDEFDAQNSTLLL